MSRLQRWVLLELTAEEAEAIEGLAGQPGGRIEATRLEHAEQLGGVEGIEVIVAVHQPPGSDAMRWLPQVRGGASPPLVILLVDGEGIAEAPRLRRSGVFAVVRRGRGRGLSQAARRASEQVYSAAVEESLHQMTLLMRAVGHNLRDLLGGLTNAVEVLSFQAGTSELSQRRAIEFLELQCRRMAGLLDDYSEVSRLDAAPMETSGEVVELGVALDRAIDRAQIEFGDSTARFERVPLPDPIWLNIDARRLEHLVRHALVYCCKGKPRGGSVRIDYQEADRVFRLSVESSSGGIYPPPVGKLGIDLDLFLARRLAELLGGRMWTGPPFLIELPRRPVGRSELPAPGVARPSRSGAPIANRNALLVDDNPASIQALGLLIGRLGWNVRVTPDTAEALKLIRAFRPCVVLIDLHMPGMDGQTLAQVIRDDLGDRSPMLIGITATSDRPRPDASGSICFDHFLTKPVRRDDIIGLLPGAVPRPVG